MSSSSSVSIVFANQKGNVDDFAFLGATPVIPVTNRDKVAGMAADASLSRRVEQLEQITPRAVVRWINEASEIQAEMTQYTTAARAVWESFRLGHQSQLEKLAA